MKYWSLILVSNLLSACAFTPPERPKYFKDIPVVKEASKKYDMDAMGNAARNMRDPELVEVIFVVPTTGQIWSNEE